MRQFQIGVSNCVHQLDALFQHPLGHDAVAARYARLDMPKYETELIVEIASASQRVRSTVPEAV